MNIKSIALLTILSVSLNASEKKEAQLPTSITPAPCAPLEHAEKPKSQLSSTDAINTQLANTLAGAIISAQNMAIGPLAAVPFIADMETYEKAVIVIQAKKDEDVVEKAVENEVTLFAHSKFVQREKSLFWSWCCASDDAL